MQSISFEEGSAPYYSELHRELEYDYRVVLAVHGKQGGLIEPVKPFSAFLRACRKYWDGIGEEERAYNPEPPFYTSYRKRLNDVLAAYGLKRQARITAYGMSSSEVATAVRRKKRKVAIERASIPIYADAIETICSKRIRCSEDEGRNKQLLAYLFPYRHSHAAFNEFANSDVTVEQAIQVTNERLENLKAQAV